MQKEITPNKKHTRKGKRHTDKMRRERLDRLMIQEPKSNRTVRNGANKKRKSKSK